MRPTVTVALAALAVCPLRAGEERAINPRVKEVIDAVSEQRIEAIYKKLESFGTRYIYSAQDDPEHGIGAARKWIFSEFQSYSPRLQVSYDTYRVRKKDRLVRDVELQNVVAVLPGTMNKDRFLIVSGHYDSAVMRRPEPGAASSGSGGSGIAPVADDAFEKAGSMQTAPGVNDDGSGTAAVLELARVMSKYEWRNSIVFIAFTGEEEGLVGSTLYARSARKENRIIDAVLNNDIIGDDVAGNGRVDNGTVQVYSEDPADSPSREIARYIKEVGERYIPGMRIELVFRQDRFGRGGDHIPFNEQGYGAVRFTTPNENFANQHSLTDVFANVSVPYTARVIRINGAALASLAMAPK